MAINYYLLDPKEWHIFFDGPGYNKGSVKTVKDWSLYNGAELVWNLGMFNMSSGVSVTYVRSIKGDLGYGGNSDVLDLDGTNKCKGYSNGIKNGAVLVNKPLGDSRTRCGIGKTVSGKVIIAQSSSKMTEASFCSKVLNETAKRGERVELFVLQDGGGSTSQYSDISKLAFYPEGVRKVCTVVCATRIAYPKIDRTLNLWKKGEDVRLLQMVLGGIENDGSFGFGTRNRLKAAQKALKLTADGSCGPLTRAALKL